MNASSSQIIPSAENCMDQTLVVAISVRLVLLTFGSEVGGLMWHLRGNDVVTS